jgi:hypothetical protein
MKNMKKTLALIIAFTLLAVSGMRAQSQVRVGIIGLDTSHSTAFTQMLNGGNGDDLTAKFRIVAAYPFGSTTIQSSMDRIPGYIEEMKKYGVEVTTSIAALLEKVDCVLLETNDGQIHLEQAAEVFRAGKICFIDKPLGATLAQAIAIYELAERHGVPMFSSSALRYSIRNQELRRGDHGKILGADCYSPHYVEPTHPDFGWYGIHGIETLYTVMGTGCRAVNRLSGTTADIVVGEWEDGRMGTFRGIKEAPGIYGGQAFTEKTAIAVGGYEGYKVLLDAILNFFLTRETPVSKAETLEIFAFMEASNMSRERDGEIVTLDEAMKKGEKEARKLLKAYK